MKPATMKLQLEEIKPDRIKPVQIVLRQWDTVGGEIEVCATNGKDSSFVPVVGIRVDGCVVLYTDVKSELEKLGFQTKDGRVALWNERESK